ncbi:MAG: hypothetical protein PHE83_18960, partial [Opitutaceae bacterium]|nr:hypothetical protein [Opitutaceae bacterium]
MSDDVVVLVKEVPEVDIGPEVVVHQGHLSFGGIPISEQFAGRALEDQKRPPVVRHGRQRVGHDDVSHIVGFAALGVSAQRDALLDAPEGGVGKDDVVIPLAEVRRHGVFRRDVFDAAVAQGLGALGIEVVG